MKKVLALAALLVVGSSAAWASYTDRSIHDAGDEPTYKHEKKSFTSPFDYAPHSRVERVVAQGHCNCFTFDSTKSTDVDGQRLTVAWDFGDGTTSDKPVVQHCFEKAGTYNVSLQVKDSSGLNCDTSVTSTKVEPNFPAQASAGPEQAACVGQSVAFDGSGSSAGSYTWDFGDGETGTGAKVNHTYQQPGRYRVTMTVDDGKATSCSTAVAVTSAQISPNASVALNEISDATCLGRTIGFNANGTGGKYTWDFGDGTTWEGGSRASHAYSKAGNYTVSVTVDDGRGFACSTASDRKSVTVVEPPTVNIGDYSSCLVSDPVALSASGTGKDLTYTWNFGDGETAEGASVNHAFAKAGSYRVTVTARDSSGSACGAASDSAVVTVNNEPEAVIVVR